MGSLAVLAYVGVLLAFSIAIDDAIVSESRPAGVAVPEVGARAIVLSTGSPTSVATAARDNGGFLGHAGAWLAVADAPAGLPWAVSQPHLVRALAYVSPGAFGAYAYDNITFEELPGAAPNLTVDVSELAAGRTGFIVKGDNEATPWFVTTEMVVGQVVRFEPEASLFWLFVFGAAGFVVPLVVVVMTHRPSGRPGLPANVKGVAGGSTRVCQECFAGLSSHDSFCLRCGALPRDESGQ